MVDHHDRAAHPSRAPTPIDERWPIVALVASAGGVDALSRAIATLPCDLPAAVIALLHSPPDRESVLPVILSRFTDLAVELAGDDQPLGPSRVVVAPPGRHVLITPELRLALIKSGAFPPSRPSADLLLTTLATAAGPRVIAAVLSGAGIDGATGASAVHRFGGTVIASDEATSRWFEMPSATIARANVIDHVVPLDEIGEHIGTLIAPSVRRSRRERAGVRSGTHAPIVSTRPIAGRR